jgi:hypothetical protein
LIPPAGPITDDEKRAEVDRIRLSSVLQNAPMLQKLLEFIDNRAQQGDTSEISEYTVAAEVFGRSGEFDPTGDTTVRTAVYRLRAKLREYYAGEGKLDEVLIEIPKGHYTLQYTRRGPGASVVGGVALVSGRSRPAVWLTLAAAAVVLFGIGVAVGNRWSRSAPAAGPPDAKTPYATSFWRSFAGGDNSILVTFANVEMLHTDSGDLLKFEGGAIGDRGAKVERSVAERSVASPELLGKHTFFYEDGYSGTGEVHAVYNLARLLATAGVDMQVKRSRLVTNYDLKNHNVVHLGAGRENLAIDNLHLKQGFVFETPRFSMWSNRILDNKSTLPGGRSAYAVERDPASGTLKVDYALFSVMPGLAPNRKIMLLAGLTTSGTEAAAEFATSEAHIAELLGRMGARTLPPYFESILEVQVVRGLDPIEVKCLAARAIED